MRKMLISGAAALLCAAALPAAAAPASNQDANQNGAQPSRSDQARGPNRRVCIRQEMSNSRIARPVCRTQQEWDRMRANGEFDDDR